MQIWSPNSATDHVEAVFGPPDQPLRSVKYKRGRGCPFVFVRPTFWERQATPKKRPRRLLSRLHGDLYQVVVHYLNGGGFENLDRLVSAFGIDVMTLISYDQFQFSESGKSSWAYWTILGAYVVKGEKNETRTMMDAVVYDIPSRAMLFHSSGKSQLAGKATPVDLHIKQRKDSEQGFEEAIDDLIANLDGALDRFAEQASTGTIRGEGTPAIAMVDEAGQPVAVGGGGGAGAFGGADILVVAILLLPLLALRRRRSV